MNVGDRIRHSKLGVGIIIEVGRIGYLIDFTSQGEVLVRGSRPEQLELINEQEAAERNGTKDQVSDRNSGAPETPRK